MYIDNMIIAKLKEDFPNAEVQLVDAGKSIKVNDIVLFIKPNWKYQLEMFHQMTGPAQDALYADIKDETQKLIIWEASLGIAAKPAKPEEVLRDKKKAEETIFVDPLLEKAKLDEDYEGGGDDD